MRKLPVLGSGLFDFDQPASPFALGSGLFGQSIPTQPQLDAVPAAGAPSFEDKLNGLIGNPAFILGMNLLGASRQANPWGTALQGTLAATSQIAKGKRDQEQMEISRQNAATQQELARLNAQRLEAELPHVQAQTERLGIQNQHDAQKIALEAKAAERQAQMQQMVQGLLGNGGLFGDGAPVNAPVNVPAGPTGKFGTPTAILDGLSRTESSGNPNALGPVLPDGTRAMGEFQFRPSTVDMLAKQGMKFDPMNPAQARDAADFYLNNLTQQHGGDLSKALAAYGGFVNKDPTDYIRKVTGQAPAPAPTPQAGSPDWQKVARTGAALGMIDPKMGGNLIDYAKLLQPQNTPAGSYRVGPNGAEYLPNPDAQARIELDKQRLGMDQGREQRASAEAGRKVTTENAEVQSAFRATDMSLTRMEEVANELAKHKGLGTMAGWSGFVGLNQLPGEGRDATAKMETLKSKLVINTLSDLKSLSKTGASGFGQLSEKEGMRLETLIANLEAAQSEPQLREAMADVAAFARETKAMLHETYKSLPGSEGRSIDTSNVRPAAAATPSATPLSLDEYLNKHRPKRTDSPISPREAVGKIR